MPGHGARVDVGAAAHDDDVVEFGLRLGFDETKNALPQRLGRKWTAPFDGDGDLPSVDGGDVAGHPFERAWRQPRLLGKLARDAGIDVDGSPAQVIAIDQTARRINAPRIQLPRSLGVRGGCGLRPNE